MLAPHAQDDPLGFIELEMLPKIKLDLLAKTLEVYSVGDIVYTIGVNAKFFHQLAGNRADCDRTRTPIEDASKDRVDIVSLTVTPTEVREVSAVAGDDVRAAWHQTVEIVTGGISHVGGNELRLEIPKLACNIAPRIKTPREAVVAHSRRPAKESETRNGIRRFIMSRFSSHPIEDTDFMTLPPPSLGQVVHNELCSAGGR